MPRTWKVPNWLQYPPRLSHCVGRMASTVPSFLAAISTSQIWSRPWWVALTFSLRSSIHLTGRPNRRAARLDRDRNEALLDQALLDGDLGFFEGGVGIAAGELHVIGEVAAELFVDDGSALLDGFLDVEHRRQRLIFDLDPLAGVLGRGPARGQHDRDRLAHVVNLVDRDRIVVRILLVGHEADRHRQRCAELRLQVFTGEDRDHAIGFLRPGRLDAEDPRVGLARPDHVHMDNGRLWNVVDVATGPRDQPWIFASLDGGADHLGYRHLESSLFSRRPARALCARRRAPSPWPPPGST